MKTKFPIPMKTFTAKKMYCTCTYTHSCVSYCLILKHVFFLKVFSRDSGYPFLARPCWFTKSRRCIWRSRYSSAKITWLSFCPLWSWFAGTFHFTQRLDRWNGRRSICWSPSCYDRTSSRINLDQWLVT